MSELTVQHSTVEHEADERQRGGLVTEQQRIDGSAGVRAANGRDRRPTMADVAKHVGVSRALVSIVFRGVDGASEATRQRVLDAAAELGYRPDSLAQGLRRSRTRNLGVLFSLRRPFEVELVEHMYPAVEKLGYHLLLGAFTPGRGQDAVVDELLSYRCEGLVVVGPELHGRDLEPIAEEVAVVEVGPGGHARAGRRRPQRRRGRHPAGGRPPGVARAPRDRLHRRGREPGGGGPECWVPHGNG